LNPLTLSSVIETSLLFLDEAYREWFLSLSPLLAGHEGWGLTRFGLFVRFESGSMPYAQQHYPFENQQRFQDNFPAVRAPDLRQLLYAAPRQSMCVTTGSWMLSFVCGTTSSGGVHLYRLVAI
jgi:hypothetical protein